MTTATTHNPFFALAKVKPNWDSWGLIDLEGNYVLEPVCHTIYAWQDGIARLEKKPSKIDIGGNWTNHHNGQYGYINSSGKMITDFSFGSARDFSHGMAAVHQNNKWGFIDKSRQLAIPFLYNDVHTFQTDGCIVSINGKWGLIDAEGNQKIAPAFDSLYGFPFGLGVASINNQSFIVNKNGNTIIQAPTQWPWIKPVSEKLILIGTTSGYPGERIYGFMDLEGNIKTEPQFYTTSDNSFDTGRFVNGKLYVETEDGKKGYVNEEGEFEPLNSLPATNVVNTIQKLSGPFDEILDFSEGFAVAKQGNFWGVINTANEPVIDFKFKRRTVRSVGDSGLYFSDYFPKYSCGLMGICEERDTIYSGYMNAEGHTVIDLKFRIAEPFYTNKNTP